MLYIMRHSRTDWNAMKKIQGRTDTSLNEDGRKMAEKARDEYKDIHFDVCYCSPLKRARETAEIFLKDRAIPLIVDNRLTEMCFGVCEGIERSMEIPDCPINVFFTNPEKYTVPVENAESLEELFSRTGEFIRDVVEPGLKQNQDILIIGHGAMNSSIICQIKHLSADKFWSFGINNCKLMKLI